MSKKLKHLFKNTNRHEFTTHFVDQSNKTLTATNPQERFAKTKEELLVELAKDLTELCQDGIDLSRWQIPEVLKLLKGRLQPIIEAEHKGKHKVSGVFLYPEGPVRIYFEMEDVMVEKIA